MTYRLASLVFIGSAVIRLTTPPAGFMQFHSRIGALYLPPSRPAPPLPPQNLHKNSKKGKRKISQLFSYIV
jgi:hypothetical protein